MSATVHIDFNRPIALFPLPSVALYPHTSEWLVAFEPRYRQMVEDCLRARGDGPVLDAAPIAMASYAGRGWQGERIGEPPLRPAVCVAKIVEHRALPVGHDFALPCHHIIDLVMGDRMLADRRTAVQDAAAEFHGPPRLRHRIRNAIGGG